jgi:GntR family transcriptional regulator
VHCNHFCDAWGVRPQHRAAGVPDSLRVSADRDSSPAAPAPGEATAEHLRRTSPVPLYFQLAEILKERIEAGHWPAGERFPSERELAEEFRISRTVIRPALDLLASDGQLVRIKGRGTFVTPPKVAWPIAGLARLLARPPGHDFEIRILSAGEQDAEPDVRETLELEPGVATVLQATAVVRSSGAPVYMSNSFIVASRLPEIAARLRSASVLTDGERVAAEPAFVPASAAIATAFVSQWEATQLEVAAGDLCFLIRYLDRIDDGGQVKPVEFARMVFRTDVVELEALLA